VLKWRGNPPTHGDPHTCLGAPRCRLRASPCMKKRDTLASIAAAAAITKEAGDGEIFLGGLSETVRTYMGLNLCLSIMMLLAILRTSMMGVTM
jgi:hypothetical protein